MSWFELVFDNFFKKIVKEMSLPELFILGTPHCFVKEKAMVLFKTMKRVLIKTKNELI